jgi:hypothetical protein
VVGGSDANRDGIGVVLFAVVGICEGKSAFVGPLEGATDESFTTGASDSSEVKGAKVMGTPVSRVGSIVGSTVGSPVGIDVGVAEGRIDGLTDGDIEWSALGHSEFG